jgi:hypothetical protein
MLGKGLERNTVKKEEVGRRIQESNQDTKYLIFPGVGTAYPGNPSLLLFPTFIIKAITIVLQFVV